MNISKINAPRAYAWLIAEGLCQWAEPTKDQLTSGRNKPSPEAAPVQVRIVLEAEWRQIKKALQHDAVTRLQEDENA